MSKKIYIAGPGVFHIDSKQHGIIKKKQCEDKGFIGLYPLDNECNEYLGIKAANENLIRESDIVVADVSPFRGEVEPDSGTAYEIGFASALGKHIVTYSSCKLDLMERVGEKFGLHSYDISRDKNNAFIENFGLNQNLMFGSHSKLSSFEEALNELVAVYVDERKHVNKITQKLSRAANDPEYEGSKISEDVFMIINKQTDEKYISQFSSLIKTWLVPSRVERYDEICSKLAAQISVGEVDLSEAIKSFLISTKWSDDLINLQENGFLSELIDEIVELIRKNKEFECFVCELPEDLKKIKWPNYALHTFVRP